MAKERYNDYGSYEERLTDEYPEIFVFNICRSAIFNWMKLAFLSSFNIFSTKVNAVNSKVTLKFQINL